MMDETKQTGAQQITVGVPDDVGSGVYATIVKVSITDMKLYWIYIKYCQPRGTSNIS